MSWRPGGRLRDGRTRLRRELCSSPNSAQQSGDEAVIRPDYHARQPGLNWNVAGETKAGWGVCYAGDRLWCLRRRLCFIQPSNQPKKCCRSNMKPSKMQHTASWRGEWVAGCEFLHCVCVCAYTRACVCVCVCVCVHLHATFLRFTSTASWICQKTGKSEKEHTLWLLTLLPLALQVLRTRGEYIRLSQDSLSTCCGEKAKEIEVNYSLHPGETHNYAKRCRRSHLRLPATIAFVPTDVGRRRKWAKKVG